MNYFCILFIWFCFGRIRRTRTDEGGRFCQNLLKSISLFQCLVVDQNFGTIHTTKVKKKIALCFRRMLIIIKERFNEQGATTSPVQG